MDLISVSATFFILGCVYLTSLLLLNLSFYDVENKKEENDTVENTKFNLRQKIRLLHNSPNTYWVCLFVLIYKLGIIQNFISIHF